MSISPRVVLLNWTHTTILVKLQWDIQFQGSRIFYIGFNLLV